MPPPVRPKLKVTNLFFDRREVIEAVGRQAAAALSRFGAFVRTRARSSMRPGGKSGKSSPPGKPPRTHDGAVKRLLFFSWDPKARSVVVGPTPFARGLAPGLLEFGGVGTVKDRAGRPRKARYRGNAFMAPALEKELPNMPKAWATAVKGS